jgi:hypothetical protein
VKSVFYVCSDIQEAINFIRVNTDWSQRTRVSFLNKDENIVVINSFERIRGRIVDKVYIDYSFESLNDNIQHNFKERFKHLGVTPINLNEKEGTQNE